jgi:hypothetical protein
MKPIPIFDTNIFDHVERGKIKPAAWKKLLRHRPPHGWPLSVVTAFELIAGFDATPQAFLGAKQRIARAYSLSKGRIHEEPRFLICRDVLHIPFPDQPLPPTRVISRHMDVIRRATSLDQLKTGVPYKLWRGAQLTSTSVYDDVMAGPKKGWIAAVKRTADEMHPGWREEEKLTGKRLPPAKRLEVKELSYWQPISFVNRLLEWLHATTDPATVTQMSQRLDAVLKFTVSVAREFVLTPYSLERHESDVFDMYQLQYLAMDKYVIVTGDDRLRTRISRSSQAHRVRSFDEFLQSL